MIHSQQRAGGNDRRGGRQVDHETTLPAYAGAKAAESVAEFPEPGRAEGW